MEEMVAFLNIENIKVHHMDIQSFLKKSKNTFSMITRGFPDNEILYGLFQKKRISQFIAYSSIEKFKAILEKDKKKKIAVYDIKNRELLKIFFMESVSRETL